MCIAGIYSNDPPVSISNENKIIQIGHIERYNSAYTNFLKNVKKPLFIEAHRLSPFRWAHLF